MEGMQQTMSWLTEAVRIQEADPSAPFIPPPEEDSEAITAYLEFSSADINAEQHKESAALLKKIIPIYSPAAAKVAYLLRHAITDLKTRLAEAIKLRNIEEIAEDGVARKYTEIIEEIAEDGVAREYAKFAEEVLRMAAKGDHPAAPSYCDKLFKELEDTLKECDAEILQQGSSS